MRKLCEWGIGLLMAVAVGTLGLLGSAATAQNIFNCTSFTSTASNACSITWPGPPNNQRFFAASNAGGSVVSGAIDFIPSGTGHSGNGLWYQTAVNDEAFTATFSFVPNGYNFAFVVQNDASGSTFSSGAGGEGGFYQAFTGGNIAPTNVFALQFDSYYPLDAESGFTYSSVQIYQTLQPPYVPGTNGAGNQIPGYTINKISTSPVPMNSPASTAATTNGDTYSVTVIYSGNTLTLSMYDVTAAGSCPGPSCFTKTWQGVYIPAIVGSTTAYVGFTAGTGETTTSPLLIKSFSYTVDSPTSGTGFTAWNANTTYNDGTVSAASPVYSVAPGSYSGTQSVTLSTSTSDAYICYALASSYPALTPQPNNNGGCTAGTLYTGPISISSTATLYAMAGTSNAGQRSTLGPPSSLTAAAYTIDGGSSASTPTFSPAAGTYSSAQSVTISAGSDATIYYTTNGSTPTRSSTQYTGPITVNSTETLQAIAVVRDDASSAVASAAYAITPMGVGSPMTCLPLQSVPGQPGTLQTACTITLNP
jgi:hypothetical protein